MQGSQYDPSQVKIGPTVIRESYVTDVAPMRRELRCITSTSIKIGRITIGAHCHRFECHGKRWFIVDEGSQLVCVLCGARDERGKGYDKEERDDSNRDIAR